MNTFTFPIRQLLFCFFILLLLSACINNDKGNTGEGAADTTPPIIKLNGESSVIIVRQSAYTDAGAIASDNGDANVAVIVSGLPDVNTVGVYTITYTATDAAKNSSSVTRLVTVTQRPFITTWKTDNPGTTLDNQIVIGTRGAGYNYQVNWGDGKSDNNVTGDITHSYDTAGTYTVSITGDFPQIFFYYSRHDSQKLMSVEQWGDIQWQSMYHAFYHCLNMVGNANDVPDLSSVKDMEDMFSQALKFNQDIGDWDVSNVIYMYGMFFHAIAFDQDIGNWDVSKVTDMSYMFSGARAFNQDISRWDTSSVTNMSGMFSGYLHSPNAFNQDIGNWDVSNVTDMSYIFRGTLNLNPDISRWNVSKVTNMSYMFADARGFNQDITQWDVSSVTDMAWMFFDAKVFNQNISGWNVANVVNMREMFFGASIFNQNIGSWNVSSVYVMDKMLDDTSLSTDNYNALLNGWSSQVLHGNLYFGAGTTKYSASSQAARDALTGIYGWTVTDGGVVTP